MSKFERIVEVINRRVTFQSEQSNRERVVIFSRNKKPSGTKQEKR